MSQSLFKIWIHLVYSTKQRQTWIPVEVRERLWAYQARIFATWESPALILGGVDDHALALFSLSKTQPLRKIVGEV